TTYNAVGQTISYSYVVKKDRKSAVKGKSTVTDDKASVRCTAVPTGLAVGGSITCTASYTIVQGDLDNGSVVNHAVAHGSFNSNPVDSNQASATVTAVQSPALSLSKTPSPTTYNAVGQTISYSYVVK